MLKKLHWQKLAETCFCQTGLNRGLNRCWQKLANPAINYFSYLQYCFYRAMHVVLARYCYRMSSVRPSVRLSVTLTYAEHIGWTSSKLVTRIISLGSSLLRTTTPPI